MAKRLLNNTTAILMGVSIAMPHAGIAQTETGGAMETACTADAALPCLTADGLTLTTEEDLAAYLAGVAEEAPGEEPAAEDVPAEQAPAAEDTAAEEVPAEEPAAEAPAAEEPVVEEAPTEQSAAEEAPAEEPATEEPAAEAAPAEEAVAEETPAEVPAVEEATTEPPAAEETPAEEVAAEEPAAGQAPPDASADDQPAAEATQTTEGATETETAGDSAAASAAAAEEEPAAAASAVEGEPTAAEPAEVEETTITEEAVRSSDEDFETTVTGKPKAEDRKRDKDGDGLSNFEKALIVGLGAVAVGALLNNGEEVVSNSGDRVVVRRGDDLRVLKDDDALLRQPGAQMRTETFSDGSTRTTVVREDGSRVVTIRAADGRVLRRARYLADGTEIQLFDDTADVRPVDVSRLPRPRTEAIEYANDEDALRAALAEAIARDYGRAFSLRQIRDIREVRELAPEIELDRITFASGSAAIEPNQARQLAALGRVIAALIEDNPGEVFLIEGHTDAVGDAGYNLALSDRRAESVALALTEYFDVPPENLVTQGYGEKFLKVPTLEAERANRRAAVRRITGLLGVNLASR